MPKPPRITVFPLLNLSPRKPIFGDHANPIRGAKLFVSFGNLVGVRSDSGKLVGNSAVEAFDSRAITSSMIGLKGVVENSYRNPRFRVRFLRIRQSSWTKKK